MFQTYNAYVNKQQITYIGKHSRAEVQKRTTPVKREKKCKMTAPKLTRHQNKLFQAFWLKNINEIVTTGVRFFD